MQEWLSGRYNKESGYCTPSVRVLVDVVEHQAGGADPSLASSLAKLTFDQYLTGAAEIVGTQGMFTCILSILSLRLGTCENIAGRFDIVLPEAAKRTY